MEFQRERVYTALNADELKPGDRVIVADTMQGLRYKVKANEGIDTLYGITDEGEEKRFSVKDKHDTVATEWLLAYLVERKENCTNCGCVHCWYREKHGIDEQRLHTCSRRIEPKTKQKAEKHYRPFKDTDELIKVWNAKIGMPRCLQSNDALTMIYIWVKRKGFPKDRGTLITSLDDDIVYVGICQRTMDELFDDYTFLDGSPCGEEE